MCDNYGFYNFFEIMVPIWPNLHFFTHETLIFIPISFLAPNFKPWNDVSTPRYFVPMNENRLYCFTYFKTLFDQIGQ